MTETSRGLDPWVRLSRNSKLLTLVLVGAGCVFLGLGVTADILGWWDKLPFVSNVVSGISTACFGVPFALIVLSYLSAQQAALIRSREAEVLKDRTLSELVRYSDGLALDRSREVTLSDKLASQVEELNCALSDVDERARGAGLGRRRTAPTRSPLDFDPVAIEGYRSTLARTAESVEQVRTMLQCDFSWTVDLRERWARLSSQWRLVDDYVRTRVYESSLEWIPDDISGRFDALLRNSDYPVLNVIAFRDGTITQLLQSMQSSFTLDDQGLIESSTLVLHLVREAQDKSRTIIAASESLRLLAEATQDLRKSAHLKR